MPLDNAVQKREMIDRAWGEMWDLEAGAIANADENRMVGHYWLRNPALAPTVEIRRDIEQSLPDVKAFATEIHNGHIQGASGPFRNIVLIGIGGSALGTQFVSHALGHPSRDKMAIHFLDSTDPDGFDRVFVKLEPCFGQTLCIVISKSGGTKEARNGMVETEAYQRQGFSFAKHSVAVTSDGSELHKIAIFEKWIRTFPMWDWIGGRTSVLSAVGLLPARLRGFDVDGMLEGAQARRRNSPIHRVAVEHRHLDRSNLCYRKLTATLTSPHFNLRYRCRT